MKRSVDPLYHHPVTWTSPLKQQQGSSCGLPAVLSFGAARRFRLGCVRALGSAACAAAARPALLSSWLCSPPAAFLLVLCLWPRPLLPNLPALCGSLCSVSPICSVFSLFASPLSSLAPLPFIPSRLSSVSKEGGFAQAAGWASPEVYDGTQCLPAAADWSWYERSTSNLNNPQQSRTLTVVGAGPGLAREPSSAWHRCAQRGELLARARGGQQAVSEAALGDVTAK